MSFPTEFPQAAVTAILGAVKTQEFDIPVLTLAGYEVLGYAAYVALGDVKYPIGASPEIMNFVNEVMSAFTPDDFKELISNFPQYMAVATRYFELEAKGFATWLIIMKLILEFGPMVLPLIKKLIALVEKLRNRE